MKFVPFRTLETERLILRDIRMEDIQEYYERLFGDGDVCRYLLVDPHQDIGESYEQIQDILQQYETGNFYRWGITEKGDDSLIGVISLVRIEEAKSECSFVYLLGCDYWNRGYGTEALKEVFRFAFEELEMERIVADHMAENPASGAVMRKAGMTHIGTEKAKYEKYGFFHDAEVYEIRSEKKQGLTVSDFQKKAAALNPTISRQDMVSDGILGLCGGAGRAAHLLKTQGKTPDRNELAGILKDIALSLAQTAQGLDLSLEEVLQAGIDK